MPVSDLLINGVQLMLMGMGIVFGFLLILVVALTLMSKACLAFGEVESLPEKSQLKKPNNTALIAVISAAVTRYRSSHN